MFFSIWLAVGNMAASAPHQKLSEVMQLKYLRLDFDPHRANAG
jgi:hypothetical protein